MKRIITFARKLKCGLWLRCRRLTTRQRLAAVLAFSVPFLACCVYITVSAIAGFGRRDAGEMRIRHIEPLEINYGKTNGKYIELYGNGHNEDGGTPENETADRR